VHLDVTCGTVSGGHGKSKGDHKDPDRAINLCLARKAKQYAPFVDKRVMTLAMNSGGRMSKDFHTVLYAFARRKVSTVLGDDGAGDGEEDTDRLTEKIMGPHCARDTSTWMPPCLTLAATPPPRRPPLTTTAP
jgi:hypothetical protein